MQVKGKIISGKSASPNYALNWLNRYKEEEKPFFLYMAYTASHDPLMA